MNRTTALAALLLVASAGCARPPSPAAPSFVVGHDGETFEQEVALRRAVYGMYGLPVDFEPRVRGLCPGARSAITTLDWAEARGELRGSLVHVAACMRDGAMRAESLTIVARTTLDDDGFVLARADRIAAALVTLGVTPARLTVEVRPRDAKEESPARGCGLTLQTTPVAITERQAMK